MVQHPQICASRRHVCRALALATSLMITSLWAQADSPQELEELLSASAQISRASDEVSFNGFLTPDNTRRLLSELRKGETSLLRITSGGGYIASALDIAEEIMLRKINVEVSSLCASSCANYIFVAGKKKHILPGAVVMWHGGADQKDFREFRECKREVSSFSGAKRKVTDESISASRLTAERERSLYTQLGVSSMLNRAGQEPNFIGRNVTHSVKDMERLGLKDVTAESGYGTVSFCKQVNKDRPSLGLVCLEITPEMIAYERARVALGEECGPDGTLRIRTGRNTSVAATSPSAPRD